MERKINKKIIFQILLLFAIFGFILTSSILITYGIFSGTHTIYENKTTATNFCIKCHPTKVSIVSVSAHANTGCICHGYNPNLTEAYNINVAHNLTKNIYCTNCHANYTLSTGNITIHYDASLGKDINVTNQSAHYIITSANRSQVYERAKQFFANSSG